MTQHKHRLLIGAHMSVAGGFEKSLERGESIGCTTIQIFTKSNRQWHASKITPEEAATFIEAQKNSPISPVIAHCTYLINIGSPTKDIEQKSVAALSKELERCQELGITDLVLHPGSRLDTDETECLNRIADNLNEIFAASNTSTRILLETMAGQGSTVGNTFEQLATILERSAFKKRLGVCFDTCHAFAAGYDFRTEETYEAMWKEFDRVIGLQNLHAIHVNDSKKELGCNVDRHENIGEGQLGLKPFELLFNDERFFDIPKILETPKDDLNEDAKNIATIMGLLSESTRKKLGLK